MKFPDITDRRLRAVALIATVLVVLALLWFAARTAQEGERAEQRTEQRDAAVGAAEGVIECVVDPATETPDDCEDEAESAQETLEDRVPPVGLTGRQRREVVLIAAELIAADPDLSEADVVDAVLARIPQPDDGRRGRPGPAGPTGPAGIAAEPPTTAEIRALVEAVYQADPPDPGEDGSNGAQGPKGDTGPAGKDATPDMVATAVDRYCSARGECLGPQGVPGDPGSAGPAGPKGDPGDPGTPGRGIASIACDSATPFTLTVTYSDGTTATYECGTGLPGE